MSSMLQEEQRAITNSSRKNEVAGPKRKSHLVVDVVTLPLDAGFFLIFINYSFHCLQTLLISWKQLHFLKACGKVF